MNAYRMLALLRDNLGEAVEANWTDRQLLARLNMAYRKVAGKVLLAEGDWLLKKSAALTASSGVISLPSDCIYPAYLEEVSSGRVIYINGTVRERRLSRLPGTTMTLGAATAYLVGNTIEVNMDGYAEQVYLWYQPRLVELHCGVLAASTGATSLVFELDNWPSGVDDYYNAQTVEVIDSTGFSTGPHTILDYVGSSVTATIASASPAPASGDYYGLMPGLPNEFLNLVILEATTGAIARPGTSLNEQQYGFWRDELKEERKLVDELLATRLSGSSYVKTTEDPY